MACNFDSHVIGKPRGVALSVTTVLFFSEFQNKNIWVFSGDTCVNSFLRGKPDLDYERTTLFISLDGDREPLVDQDIFVHWE